MFVPSHYRIEDEEWHRRIIERPPAGDAHHQRRDRTPWATRLPALVAPGEPESGPLDRYRDRRPPQPRQPALEGAGGRHVRPADVRRAGRLRHACGLPLRPVRPDVELRGRARLRPAPVDPRAGGDAGGRPVDGAGAWRGASARAGTRPPRSTTSAGSCPASARSGCRSNRWRHCSSSARRSRQTSRSR